MKRQTIKRLLSLLVTVFFASTITNAQWEIAGSAAFSSGNADYITMAIGTNDTVYYGISDGGNSGKATVYKYNGTSWSEVGASGGFSDGSTAYNSLAINSAGVPYMSFYDASNSFYATVMRYNGTSWDTVGNKGFSGAVVSYTSLTFGVSDTPYIVFRDASVSNEASVMKYNGTGWVLVGPRGFTSTAATDPQILCNSTGIPYVMYKNAAGKAVLERYTGGSWDTVGLNGFTVGSINSFHFAMNNDTPYVAFQEASSSPYGSSMMKYNGSSWVYVGSDRFSSVNGGSTSNTSYLRCAFDNNDVPYVAYRQSNKARVMKYNGSSWVFLGDAGFSAGANYHNFLVVDNIGRVYLGYQDGANAFDATVMKYSLTTWNGTTWSDGTPTSSTDAAIASNTTPGSFTCKALIINKDKTLTLGSANTATIYDDITNDGNGVSGTGTIALSKTGTIELHGKAISTKGTVTVNTGCTLDPNDLLTLASDASNTGRIGNSAGSISDDITVERYVSGKRAYRFLGHPFNSSKLLSTLTDDIDITGNGGATNGFTTTLTNNSSAYAWNATNADTVTAGNNPGWDAFSNTTSDYDWGKGNLLRVLIRGAKGEGLTSAAYTPSAVTLDVTGRVNVGTQTITLTKGSNSTFVACGNPLPSPVQMNTILKGSNVGANYYVWDATSGVKGAYVTNAFTLSYILPSWGAFFTTVSANSNNTLEFEEADKSGSAPASIFKTTGSNNWVELLISDSTLKWDRLLINFDDNSMDVQDKLDAKKLYNPGLDFYTLSKDETRLAIDVRPYKDGNAIPLGLTAYNRYNKYVIHTGDYSVPAGTKLVLHDKFLNNSQELKAGFEYWFDVTSDTNSQGINRFEINMVGKPTDIVTRQKTIPQIQLIPNPAYDKVKVSFKAIDGVAQVKLISITGRVVYTKEVYTTTGSVIIPLNNMPSGMYIVTLDSENARFTEKLIIE